MIDAEKVILGAAQLGLKYGIANQHGQPSIEEARQILESSAENGIKRIDTAIAYGSSQAVLGQIHGNRFDLMSKWVEHPSDLSMSLELLKSEKLDVWMAHRCDVILKNPSLWGIMQDQQAKGLVNSIGVSAYGTSEVQALLEVDIVPDVVQLPINVLSKVEIEAIEKFKEVGITIHARSIFLQGLLLCNPRSLDSFFEPIKPWLEALSNSFSTRQSRVQALIQAVQDEPAIDFVVLGAESSIQIHEWFDSNVNETEELPSIPDSLPERILNPTMWPK